MKPALVAIALISPSVAQADALQQQVLAIAKAVSAADFAFTQTARFERTGTPATERVSRYDPARGWTLLRIDGKPPTAKQTEQDKKIARRAQTPSYARITEWFGAPATRIATTPTSVTYRFATLPKGSIKLGPYDASAHTTVDAVVNTAGKALFVERARFTSTKPFRMFVVAKVERFTVNASWRLMPDGRPVGEGNTAEFGGAFMGKAQTIRTRTTYSDYSALR